MRTDGRTEGQGGMTKLMVTFRSFSNAPKLGCVALKFAGMLIGPCELHEGMRENGGVNVLRNRRSCQLQDPTTLPSDKQFLCPLTGRHIGPQISSGQFGEKIILLLSGVERSFFHHPSLSSVLLPYTLSRVLHATSDSEYR
jgi:hypothetical protein